MQNIQPITLQGNLVMLEPLHKGHREALFANAQDASIWTFTASQAYGVDFNKWFDYALNGPDQLAFVVRRLSDNKIVGSTRYYDINSIHRRLTIGFTWYVTQVWGSYVNPESKLLLLTHAFEIMNFNRVEFLADFRNLRSRTAILKLGAKEEGILRQHMRVKDYIRDSVIYSIIKSEWPNVKKKLKTRIMVKNNNKF